MAMLRVMNCYLPLAAISAVEIKPTGAVVHLSPDAADVLSRNHIEVPIDDTPALCDWLDAMIEPPLVLHELHGRVSRHGDLVCGRGSMNDAKAGIVTASPFRIRRSSAAAALLCSTKQYRIVVCRSATFIPR